MVPKYPSQWESVRIQGSVTAEITVLFDGSLSAELSGAKVYFGQAVADAVAKSRLSPADCNGARFKVVYQFVLQPTGAESGDIVILGQMPPWEVFNCPGRPKSTIRQWFRSLLARN